MKPGSSDAVLKMAAKLALGKKIQRPRFGVLGSIATKLGLFNESDPGFPSAEPTHVHNTYNAPVQIFNGPVFLANLIQCFSG